MAKGFSDGSISIGIRPVLKYLNFQIDDQDKTCCPFHKDDTPSMIVNHDYAWCFGCGRGWSTAEFLMDWFDPAVKVYGKRPKKADVRYTLADVRQWVEDHQADFPLCKGTARKKIDYQGPVKLELVKWFHQQLPAERREQLHRERLLTDETIDQWLIGWRPDFQAFSIPFWSGSPGESEIAIMQFRKTERSPTFLQQKFIGLKGHNKPYLIGLHSLTRDWAFLLFGTFDAVLAVQDGFPAVSPNGASVFSTRKHAGELDALLSTTPIKRLYAVFDGTESERAVAQKTLSNITVCQVETREFPSDLKDYGEYRLKHNTNKFLFDIIGVQIL